MTARGRNIVIGMASGFDWDVLAPFVRSLRDTGYSGEIRMFVGENVDAVTKAQLDAHGVSAQPFRRLSGRARQVARLHSAFPRPLGPLLGRRTIARATAPHVARFFLALEVVERTACDGVLLSDTRDVLFQRDPFDFAFAPDEACYFLEDERMTIGTCPFNSEWIGQAYGLQVLNDLADRPISCSGVTIGGRRPIIAYLRAMVATFMRRPRQVGGMDQGVHNYLVHNRLVPGARLIPNGAGPVLTMGYMRKVTDADLRGGDGRPVNVLHQYDRHPALATELTAAYRSTASFP